MRFMVMVKGNKDTEAGVMPSEAMLTAMGRFNEEMVKAGVMLSGEGLHPSVKGARIRFADDGVSVVDGPFPVSGDLVCGFWLIQTASREEAIAWMKRAPFEPGSELELRQVFEAEDFGEAFTPELREQEERLRTELAARQ
jgi:glutathione S-transferase